MMLCGGGWGLTLLQWPLVNKGGTNLAVESGTAGIPINLPAERQAFLIFALIRGPSSSVKPVCVFRNTVNRQLSSLYVDRASDNKASRSLSPI